MQNSKPSSKMFLDIVGKLKTLINEEGIKTGGKLPSERELAERLHAGRSTVREALRSLELLGLIETRRGEGTFLADFKKHQMVEVLSAFIMQQPGSHHDVKKTRRIHEIAALSAICREEKLRRMPVWEGLLLKMTETGTVLREDVIREIIVAAGNRLSLKIWFLLKQYSMVPFGEMTDYEENRIIGAMLRSLQEGFEAETIESYEQWIERVEGE